MSLRIGTHTVFGNPNGLQHISRMQADEQNTILREAKLHGHSYFSSRAGGHYKVTRTNQGLEISPTTAPGTLSKLISRPSPFTADIIHGDPIGSNYLTTGMSSAERDTILHHVRMSGRAGFIHKNTHYSIVKNPGGQYTIVKEGTPNTFGLRPPLESPSLSDTTLSGLTTTRKPDLRQKSSYHTREIPPHFKTLG